MSETDTTARLDEIEDELATLREQIGRYRRAMLGSRVVIVAGLTVLVAVYTALPALGSTAIVVCAITGVVGATVWLGSTKSSKEELDARLARTEAERANIFDRVAAFNGWNGRSPSRWPARE